MAQDGQTMPDDIMVATAARTPGVHHLKASAGDVLFRPHDECRGFIALRSGSIRVGLTSAGGREVVLYRVGPGEICLQTFSCLAEGKTYAAEGVAELPVDAMMISPTAFDQLMSGDPAFRRAVLASVAARFADFEQVVQTLAFTGLEARVAAALIRLADRVGRVSATHADIASEIGSAREAVSRQLGLFARQGLVTLGRGYVEIRRRDALAGLSDTDM